MPPTVGIIGAILLYIYGWLFEDTHYWLAASAVAIWVGLLPLWLLLVAFVWRAGRRAWHAGFAIAVPILVIHTSIAWTIRRHLNDDHVGIAAVFAVAALAGWLAGRLAHALVRRARARRIIGSLPL